MPYSTNSITSPTIAATSSVSCNVAKLTDTGQENLVVGDTVSLQTVSTGGDTALTGTANSTGTAVVGTGTAFDTELNVGDVIYDGSGEYRSVASITDATNLVLNAGFTVDLSGSSLSKKEGAQVREVSAIFPVASLVHFDYNLSKPLDGTDAEIRKLG